MIYEVAIVTKQIFQIIKSIYVHLNINEKTNIILNKSILKRTNRVLDVYNCVGVNMLMVNGRIYDI